MDLGLNLAFSPPKLKGRVIEAAPVGPGQTPLFQRLETSRVRYLLHFPLFGPLCPLLVPSIARQGRLHLNQSRKRLLWSTHDTKMAPGRQSNAYDDEELSISLSSTQIRRNKSQQPENNGASGDSSGHNTGNPPRTPATDRESMSSDRDGRTGPSPVPVPPREKARTELRIGQYNVIRTLGEGSFGKVKLAVHRSTGQQVALKIIARKKLISRDMQGRVEREIEYLQLLRHPHIIKL